MPNQFDTYIQKLKHYKELYLIDEEAYGDLSGLEINETRAILDDFVRYVELTSSSTRPSQQANWCDPSVESGSNNLLNFKRYGFEL
tara:strand:+ start:448 stop:705 length:258 start_codon:yes stop_codon:yes gene_type:complete